MPPLAPLRLNYRLEAKRDLEDLIDFIARDRPMAAAIKYLVTDDVVHILGVSYRGRDLDAFFASRRP